MPSREVSRQVTFFLIELLKEHECLWNKHAASYNNHAVKNKAYQSIYEAMLPFCEGLTTENLKSRVRVLKMQFLREKKKLASSGGSEKICQTWLYYDKLTFLGADEVDTEVARNMAQHPVVINAQCPLRVIADAPSHAFVSL